MWGKTWFLQYCNRYGNPVTIYTVSDELQAQKKRAELLQNPCVTDIVKVGDQTKVEVMSASGGASMPHSELLKMAEAACHKLILGQTLTSDTSDNGGSLAQAKVHNSVQKSEELKLGEWVCDILNQQLVPAIIFMNFGKTEGIEMPEIRCTMPEAKMNMAKIEYYKALKEIGVDVPMAKVYDDLGLPMPDSKTETMGWEHSGPETPPDGGGTHFGGNTQQKGNKKPAEGQQNAQAEKQDEEPDDENAQAARSVKKKPVEQLTDEELEAELKEAEELSESAYRAWITPTLDALERAADGKMSIREFKAALDRGEMNPDTYALAEGLLRAAGKPYLDKQDRVSAANPYGCNGAGHKNGCPKGTTGEGTQKRTKRTAAAALEAVHSALENPDESIPPLFIIKNLKENGEEEDFKAYKQGVRDGAARGDFSFTTVDDKGKPMNAALTTSYTKHLDEKGEEGDIRYTDLPNLLKTVKSPDGNPTKDGDRLIYRKEFSIKKQDKKRTKKVTYRVTLSENGEFITAYKEEQEKAFKAKQRRKQNRHSRKRQTAV